jgi:dolichol-phosphate mannosyltransferase
VDRVLVLIPTFNEEANAERLGREILALGLDLDILFVDDNSTDGTGAILEALALEQPRVHVMHRPGKLGVGSAHATGIRWAYERKYSQLVTMDCDFTHDPQYIQAFLAEAEKGADVVVGSRYLQKSSLADWNPYRKAMTRVGHLLTRALLGMPYDATSAFRWYRLTTVPCRLFDVVVSGGYSFFFESLYVLCRNGFHISEIPVKLPKRTYGSSKMSPREVGRSLWLLLVTCLKAFFKPKTLHVCGEAKGSVQTNARSHEDQGWDAYWDGSNTRAWGPLYDTVASFYRRRIIRPSLNRFVRRHFQRGAHVLHAGCGSGQVDADIRHHVSIIGLDISARALHLYRRSNGGPCDALQGSILCIPLLDNTMDGVYNLGVMEHFHEDEISKILREFHRVLKDGGRALVFWPPEFGLSVLFFKGLRWIFRHILRKKNAKFHPDEITRVRSFRHVTQLFEAEGFRVLGHAFGPRDLFTYVVVAAQRVQGEARSKASVLSRGAGGLLERQA